MNTYIDQLVKEVFYFNEKTSVELRLSNEERMYLECKYHASCQSLGQLPDKDGKEWFLVTITIL